MKVNHIASFHTEKRHVHRYLVQRLSSNWVNRHITRKLVTGVSRQSDHSPHCLHEGAKDPRLSILQWLQSPKDQFYHDADCIICLNSSSQEKIFLPATKNMKVSLCTDCKNFSLCFHA